MNKKELIKQTSKRTKLSQADCLKCVNAIKELIYDALKKGDKVNLVGFGRFEVKARGERKIINPMTKEISLVPPKKVPVFKTGRLFKSAIR